MNSQREYLAIYIIFAISILARVRCDEKQAENDSENQVVVPETTLGTVPDLCPCLPQEYCPRLLGTSSEDAKYLGEILKCPEAGHIRCCGVVASDIMRSTPKLPMIVTSSMQMPEGYVEDLEEKSSHHSHTTTMPTASTTFNNNDSESRSDNTEPMEDREATSEMSYTTEAMTETTEYETTESEREITTEYTPDSPATTEDSEAMTTISPSENEGEDVLDNKTNEIKVRRPKLIDNVMMVYPNEMSGVPKTTPKNMPDEINEMQMFDDDMGMDLHIIFSTNQTTALPLMDKREEIDLNDLSTNELSHAASNTRTGVTATTESTTTTTHKSKPKRRRFSPYRARSLHSTTEEPVDTTTTTKRTRVSHSPNAIITLGKPRIKSRVRDLYKKPTTSPENTDDATTMESNVVDKVENSQKETPILRDKVENSQKETPILRNTSKSRKQLFNSVNRLNFLRRKANETITTTEAPAIETRPSSSIAKKNLEKPIKKTIDSEHKLMMEKVHLAIKAFNAKGKGKHIPRTFSGPAISNRMDGLEKMLAQKINSMLIEIANNTIEEKKETENVTQKPFRGLNRYFNSTTVNRSRLRNRLGKSHSETITTTTTTPKPEPQHRISAVDRLRRRNRLNSTVAPKVVSSTTEFVTETTTRKETEITQKPKSSRRRVKVSRRKSYRGRNVAGSNFRKTTTASTEGTTELDKSTTVKPSETNVTNSNMEPRITSNEVLLSSTPRLEATSTEAATTTTSSTTPTEAIIEPITEKTTSITSNNRELLKLSEDEGDDQVNEDHVKQVVQEAIPAVIAPQIEPKTLQKSTDAPIENVPTTPENPILEAVKETVFRRSTTWNSHSEEQFRRGMLPPPRTVPAEALSVPSTSFLFRPSSNQLLNEFPPLNTFPINGHQKPHPLDIIGPVPALKNVTPEKNKVKFGLPAEVQRTQFAF